MSTIALLGGTGRVGRIFAELALEAGHSIRALVRDPGKLEIADHDRVTVFQGDATSSEDVEQVVEGADIVVSCVGNPIRGVAIMEATTQNVLDAAARQDPVPRCAFISSIGCGGTSWLVSLILPLFAGRKSWADYEAADRRIRTEETVPFTLVRPAGLTDKPASGYDASTRPRVLMPKSIARADVAAFLLTLIDDTQWDGEGVQITGT